MANSESRDAKRVMIIGTGTIGEPLTVLLATHMDCIGIDEVIFSKHNPRLEDRPMVLSLQAKGASLAVGDDRRQEFVDMGIEPKYSVEEARKMADVIVDCTPKGIGLENKERFYVDLIKNGRLKVAIAEGSENGYGKKFAYGINDQALVTTGKDRDRFIQVVSCNTHNLAIVLQLLAGEKLDDLVEANFVCIRRANDVSQNAGGKLAPNVDAHKDLRFGTHHARDAYMLYQTIGVTPKIFSSSMIVPTQLMHTIHFRVRLNRPIDRKEILERCQANLRMATTYKVNAANVFSFGRDHSEAHGRILNSAVLSVPTLQVFSEDSTCDVVGYCFTPQDGNSLISSVAAICWAIQPERYHECVNSVVQNYLFQEV